MTVRFTWWLLALALAGCGPAQAGVPWPLLTNRGPQCVFAGPARQVDVIVSNGGDHEFVANVQVRIYQMTSGTGVWFVERPWKKLRVLPQQTIFDSARLDFPAVNAATKFQLQWLINTNGIIGSFEISVYPTNLLAELKPMTGDDGPGLYDPQNQIKPLLKNLKQDFMDLEVSGFAGFSGKLAIVGPFDATAQMRPGLPAQIKALAKKNVAVVWLLPPPEKRDKLVPSFYPVMENTNAVIVVQPDLVSNLPENPRAQLNLIYFCKLALKPEPMTLPDFPSEP
jgi:hypothetical protein